MSPVDRRRFLLGAASLAGLAAIGVSCTSDDDGAGSATSGSATVGGDRPGALAPGAAGLIDEDLWKRRSAEYLKIATAEPAPGNPTGIVAHLARSRREPEFTWPAAEVTPASLAAAFDKIDAWEDTRDFDLLYLLWVWRLGGDPTTPTPLGSEVLEAIRQRFVANRYRYDDPLPADRVDELWYWSENHRLITLTIEHLAGQFWPDLTFPIAGLTGAQHRDRAKQPILDWIDERARFGFFEWHSNVYMLKNISPLVTLIELADDEDLVDAATLALDLCLADVAAHLQAGSYCAPRGRTYKKDKMTARDEATFGTAKLLFDDTDLDYPSVTDTGATYLAAAARYRVPQAIIDVAKSEDTSVVRERHGIFLDGGAPITDPVEAPYGYDFEDPANLPLWWSLGAIGTWQTVRVSLAEAKKHRLFETKLLEQVKLLAELNGNDPERIRPWVQERHAVVNFGNLSEANTYAWRSPDVSLASVVDHRFGQLRDQAHAWQAQIDADALVFTNHPVTPLDASTDWDDDGRPGYWTGEASMPRSAQHERTAVHIYQPAWDESTDSLLWGVFGYQPFTHAYVPQSRFDTVTQQGNWTVASKGDGHIALWSWRTPTFETYDPAVYATDDMDKPFDLIAAGGPDNVWIVEVGTAADGDHQAFLRRVTEQEPTVDRTDDGFTVAWISPSSGEIGFGSTGPFTVDGAEIALDEFPRHESPWGQTDHLAKTFALHADKARLHLDFAKMARTLS